MAFGSLSLYENMMVYARQLIMWVIMMISPTPGGSGLAEISFSAFLSDFIHGDLLIVITIAILWRILSYYPYLFIGAIIFPHWLKRKEN